MNKIKRGLALLLTVILLCTALPISAQAKTTGNKTVNKANIVLFGYFADDTQTAADAYFNQYAGELVGYIDGSFGRSLKNYLSSISYGQLHMENTIPQYDGTTVHALQVPVKESDALVQNLDTQIIESLIRQMPSIADKAVDLDGDGYVDNVMVILKASRSAEAASATTLVAHKSDYSGSAKINNKPVVGYNVFGTDRLRSEGSSLLAHEYLHTFGYPDLYRNSGDDRPVYSWSVMGGVIPGSPQYPLAYERMYFTHWIDIDTVTKNSTLTLDDQANADGNQAFILKSPLNDHEIFVVEYRKKPPINYTEQDSLDCRIGGTGVIVYRVNLNVDGLTNLRGYTGIYVFRPQSGQPGYTGNEILDVSHAYLPYKDDSTGKTRSTIGSADMSATLTDGALTFSDGSNSGIVLKNIAVSADKQQATLEVEIPQKSDYDLWQDLNYAATGNMTYGVTMTEVDGALYTVAAENKKIRSRKYENGAWTDFAPEISENFASEFQLARQGSNLYMAFNDTNGAARLMRYDLTAGGSWQAVRTVDNAGTGVSLRVIGGKLYMACITNRQVGYMYYNDLLLMQVDGTCAATVGNQAGGCGGYKPLKGADVTLVALPYDGYTFVGWYDKINHRYMSRNTTYHFTATTNAQLQAVCVKTGSSTLTFATESGWISATVTRTTAEWAATDSLADLLPEVPYRYGYTATGWDCDERTVLEKLRSGQNVTLLPTYTADSASLPTPSPAKDGVPVLDLYYKLDEKNNVGSFVMAAGWPDYLDIQSVGVAFYYKDAADFDPTDFTLLLNNKMLASNFNTDSLEETYVVNIKKLSNRYNWAARGYVNYYDQNGKLQTVYSNQINLIAREQV